ncbi:hypothetical protein HDC94_000496 [Leifsonia sp. AK011]|uniref:hypothetical protein n=1 Tax=Leifsonia sp. AK011 TaxID=2723075 RepID=UPI0015CCDB2D|nr:hypothetical protein [Leifsonia sp. AK011]NYF09340.1 hypothetical protein [Leifsonia sp. AK011]
MHDERDHHDKAEVEIEIEGTTADPTADDGQFDSQSMPTTDGEMTDPEGEVGWEEFQESGTLEEPAP